MYAIASAHLADSGESLSFWHLFNTYVFKLYSPPDNHLDSQLISLTLSSEHDNTPLSGSFRILLNSKTGESNPIGEKDISGGNNFISACFGQGVRLGKGTGGEETTISLVALPVDQSELKLTLRFDDGATRSI